MTGDGAYDGQVVYDAVAQRHPEAAVIIPPRSTAVSSEGPATQRDKHLEAIARLGRLGWQRSSGYCRRSLVETAMYRYKTIIAGVFTPDFAQSKRPRQRSAATSSTA